MGSFYTNLASTASRLLNSYGQTIAFSRETGTIAAGTGVYTPGTPITFTGKGADFDYLDSELIDTMIERGDKRIILEAGTAPEIGDKATIGGVAYRVINVQTTAPGGTVVKI